MYWGSHYWGMHMFWWIFWLALTAVLLFGAWPKHAVRRDGALDALRRRYAAGEISDEEYHHRLAVLAGREHAPPAPSEPPKPQPKAQDSTAATADRPGASDAHSPSAA